MIRSTVATARRAYSCDTRVGGVCRGSIYPGDRYRSSVASPNHDDLGNTNWWRLRECEPCAEACGRPLDAQKSGSSS